MIVASFAGADGLVRAVRCLRAAGFTAETRTSVALPGDEAAGSRIPVAALCAGVAAAAAAFGMQCYATMVSYPLLIGGRPNFFWTSFIVYSVECGILAATLTAFLGFLGANGMPRLYEPSDESALLRRATSDGWLLVAHGGEGREGDARGADAELRRLLRELDPLEIEQVPA